MSRRIPQSFISELVARTDLVDLVGQRVTLKRAGSIHKGLCPFHDEKTPSFTVNADKAFFKCYGCGVYGNAIDFLMRYENREFLDALEILADIHNLEIPTAAGQPPPDRDQSLYDVLREADQLFRAALRDAPSVIAYLKKRGIDGETAARFGLGFAPDAWQTVTDRFGNTPTGLDRLMTAGLTARSDTGRHYDRFRNRVTFPIRDGRGRVIGFGGRLIGDGEPKYLNSPDTPLFDKSRTLYGLYEARRTPGRPQRLIVVEGFLDVIALDQHGLGPAVATMGTAATGENMRQLTRLSDRLVFCFDGDRAGREAAWRAVEAILPFGGGKVDIDFMLLPDGEDPDSLVRRPDGVEAFDGLLRRAAPLSNFMIEQAGRGIDLTSADGRARLLTTLRPLIGRLPEGHYRELVIAGLADRIGLSAAETRSHVDPRPVTPDPPSSRRPNHKSAMRAVLTFLLHHPEAASAAGPIAGLDEFDAPGADLLREVLAIACREPRIRTGELIERFRDGEQQAWVSRLAADEPMPLENDADAPKVLKDSIEQLVSRHEKAAKADALRAAGPRLGADGR